MTATITPERSAPRAGRAGFAALLHAEWTKFRTVRGWLTAIVVAALLTVLIGVWAGAGGQNGCGQLITPGTAAGGVAVCHPDVPIGPGGEAVTDSFYFVHQPLAGHGSLTVRVTSMTGAVSSNSVQPGGQLTAGRQPWSKAGIIIKASTRPGSAYAAVMLTGGHGVRMQDDYTHDTAGLPGTVSAGSPRWLRLVRSGDTVTGYDSPDGTHWTRIGAASLAGLPSTVQAGVFVASPEQVTAASSVPTLATAHFDQVSGPRRTWSGGEVGSGAAYQPLPGAFHQADDGFTVSGSGDIAPAVPGPGGGKPADYGLTGAFAGLIVVIVVGTMFITAEYRRGLIRTTLTASPRRGQVLAAKAIVAGAVAFVAGAASAAVLIPLGGYLMRGHGTYVLPMTWLTGLRVVTGTAALFALAAVLALALGTILRHAAGPVTGVITLVVVPYFLTGPLSVLPAAAATWLLRVTPAAGFAVQQVIPAYSQVSNPYTPMYGYYPLAPWAGFAVLCGWVALALVVALILLRRRDA